VNPPPPDNPPPGNPPPGNPPPTGDDDLFARAVDIIKKGDGLLKINRKGL
jgi:hypothetical protein